MALIRIHEKPNAIPVNASVFVIETQVSGVWYTQKVTWEQLVGLISALDNLQNYYKKSETYTKQEVQALIAQIPSFTVEVVQQLPTEDISTTTLYLVPKSTPEAQDYYEEYINLDGTTSGWEYVGTTQVDLSNYYTKAETEAYVKGDGADYIVGTKTFSTLTTTAKSILGAINEVAGAASSAQADATQALADASTAQGTANSASAAASAAQTTADAAATAAGNAASAASAAQTTANAAQTAAGNAQQTADAAAAGLLLKEDKTAMPEDVADIIRQMKTPKTVTGNPVTFETVEETYAKGAELTFSPKQSGTGDPSPTNVRPISGRDSLSLTRNGKNLVEITKTGSITTNGITWTVNSDGTITANGTATSTSVFLLKQAQDFGKDLQPNTEYIMSSGYGNSNVWFGLYYDDSTSWAVTVANDGEKTFTTISDFNYVRFAIRIGNGTTVNNVTFKPMVRLSTISDSTFEKYNGQTHTATFTDTVYGGKWLPQEGKAVITHAIVDLGSLTWSMTSTSGCFHTHGLDSLAEIGTTGQADAISTIYTNNPTARDVESMPDYSFCVGGSQSSYKLFIKDTRYTSASDFGSAISGQKIYYKLSTPTEIPLSAEQIELLKGTNVVSTDADTAAVTYTEMTTLDDMRTLINAAQNA